MAEISSEARGCWPSYKEVILKCVLREVRYRSCHGVDERRDGKKWRQKLTEQL